METIPLQECTRIGCLQKPHGVHGKMYFSFEENFEQSVESTEILFIKSDGLLVPFFVENQELEIISNNRGLVKFRWIDTEEKAKEFTGCEIYLKKNEIIITSDSELDALIGFEIYNADFRRIGPIKEVNDYSGNIVFTVNYLGNDILIPYHTELIIKKDSRKKILALIIPDELFITEQ